MSYIDIFGEFALQKIKANDAVVQIKQELQTLLQKGEKGDAARAKMCLIFFTRYGQYNSGTISRHDLLLFVRDFILFVGRFPMPGIIEYAIRESGTEYGLSVAADGCADAATTLPEWFPYQSFVNEVYSLIDDKTSALVPAIGDGIVTCYSRFTCYRSIEQKIAIHAAVRLPEDYTMMVSLPTGGGKSLITQMVAATSQKLTIVLVPTVALASDQYLQAQNCIATKTIQDHIFCYRSDTEPAEAARMLQEIASQKARLIFTSPEAVMKNLALNEALIKAAEQKYLCNVIIDEAHIVPDWGTHFRPDFQIFSVFLRKLRSLAEHTIRTYLLSATLSEDVVQVLFDLFGQEGKNVQYRCDTLRKEPRFILSECRSYQQRENRVLELVKMLPKPLILYVIEPAQAEHFKKCFTQQGYKNVHTFTGKTPSKQREKLLRDWKEDLIDVMIATSAFGMGVDKSNVRTVLHACVPENLSRFYQEVGRAGRDSLPSLSVMLPYIGKTGQQSDLEKAFGLVSKSILGVDKLLVRWYSMVQSPDTYIEGDRMTVDLNTVPSTFSDEDAQYAGLRNMMWNVNALLLLHREQYIDIQDAQFVPEKNTYSFTFQLCNTERLMNEDSLRKAIEPDRRKEYEMRTKGYQQMADLARHPATKCWGRRLTTLFPLAEESCSGCPVHQRKPNNYDDAIKIREAFPIEFSEVLGTPRIKKMFGSLHDVIVPVDDWQSLDLDALIIRTNDMGIDCIVLPDVSKVTAVSEGMILQSDEFITISELAPWLFQNGVLIVFDENQNRNNKLFEMSHTRSFAKIKKILLAREDMMIFSQMRPLNEFLECNYEVLSRFQEE